MSDFHRRIGTSINELDIDFSRFTFAGWCVSLASLALGMTAALAAYWAVVARVRDDRGPALAFGLVMIGTTVVTFLSLRWVLSKLAIPILRPRGADDGRPLN